MSWEETCSMPKANSSSSHAFKPTKSCRSETPFSQRKIKKLILTVQKIGVMLNGGETVCKGIVCQCFWVLVHCCVFIFYINVLTFSDFSLFQLPCHFTVSFSYCILHAHFGLPKHLAYNTTFSVNPILTLTLTLLNPLCHGPLLLSTSW